MKTTTIQFNYDEAKLNAIRLYLKDKKIDLNAELRGFMETLYKKIVPTQVRGFIERTSGDKTMETEEIPHKRVTAKSAICGDNSAIRTNTHNVE